MTAYEVALILHSWVRWAVVIFAFVVTNAGFRGFRDGNAWTPVDEKRQIALLAFADLQLVVGALLYLLWSPLARAFVSDPGHFIHDHTIRFFGLEHPFMMLVAIVLLHVGRSRSKKVEGPRRHRVVAIFGALAVFAMITSVPWPGLRHGRPLLRTPGADRVRTDGQRREPGVRVTMSRRDASDSSFGPGDEGERRSTTGGGRLERLARLSSLPTWRMSLPRTMKTTISATFVA